MESIFLKDMFEQPEAIKDLLSKKKEIRSKAGRLTHENILFLGMGASHYASIYATVYLRLKGINAVSVELSEFIWYANPDLLKFFDTIFLISQSGETAELTRFVDLFNDKLNRCVLVTNNENSFNASAFEASRLFPIYAGHERAMGSSKTFINTIVTLLLIAETWTGDELPFEKLPEALSKALEIDVSLYAKDMLDSKSVILVGRGFAVPVLKMAQLTLAEIAKVSSVVYSGAGFRHGPMELLVTDPLITVVAQHGRTSKLTFDLIGDLSFYQKVWCITDENVSFQRTISTPDGLIEELSCIPVMAIFQKVANEISIAKGYEPGVGLIASKVTKKE